MACYGVAAGIAKVREAGFSGSFTEKQPQYWKPLILELSLKGALTLVWFLIQMCVFSISLYAAFKFVAWYFGG